MKRCLLVTAFLISATIYASAQGDERDCAQKIRLAQSIYDQGRLQEAESILVELAKQISCNKQEKVAAYKLLCLTHIYLEEPVKADEDMLQILKTDPYFEINEVVDPAEFVALYKTFRTNPIYRLGAVFGGNASQPNVRNSIIANNADDSFTTGISFHAGVNAEFPLTEKLTLNPSLLFAQKSFNRTSELDRGSAGGQPLSNTTTATETQLWLSAPVVVQYLVFPRSAFQPYVSAGVSFDYLLNASMLVETIQDGAGAVQEKTVGMTREPINLSAVVAAGGRFRIFGGYVTGEVRYLYGFSKVNSEKTYYKNQQTVFDNNIGDPLFSVNSLFLNIGYVQNIFNPKKKKNK